MKLISLIMALLAISVLFSCEKEETGEQINITSTSTSSDSHNNGQNCMNCHKSGGSGDGWFVVAGSVYNTE